MDSEDTLRCSNPSHVTDRLGKALMDPQSTTYKMVKTAMTIGLLALKKYNTLSNVHNV